MKNTPRKKNLKEVEPVVQLTTASLQFGECLASAARQDPRLGARDPVLVEERVRAMEPACSPAEHLPAASNERAHRRWRRRIRRQRPTSGLFIDAARRRPEYLVARTRSCFVIHEGMDHSDDREARRRRRVRDRRPAAVDVPAKHLWREPHAPKRVQTLFEPHAPGWHLVDVCATCCVEHVGPLEEARERAAVLAIANKAEPIGRRHVAGNSDRRAAPASKRNVGHGERESHRFTRRSVKKPCVSGRAEK